MLVWGSLRLAPIKINNVYGNLKDQMKLDLCQGYTHGTMKTAFVGEAVNYYCLVISTSVGVEHCGASLSEQCKAALFG